jgi:tripartite ATP-independent transporter DctM subunit
MVQQGYNKPLATGTIAASGTLGILIPPSIMLVIMAELLARSVGNLFVAAIIPGFMLAGFYMLYILVLCGFKPQLAPPLAAEEGPDTNVGILLMVVRSFIPPLFLVFLVLGSILFGWATPTEAAGVGGAGAILLAILKRRLTFSVLKDVLERSALTGGMLFGIFLGATCFSYVFRALGGDDLVIGMVEHLGLGPWGLLLVLMALVFFLGFFFDWIEITLIVLPVFAPIVAELDFGDHVARGEMVYWFAILLAVNLQTSFLTPPFGFALFYMKGVAPPEVRIQHIYKGIVPFVMLQLVGLGLVMAFPDLALWLPRVLLN